MSLEDLAETNGPLERVSPDEGEMRRQLAAAWCCLADAHVQQSSYPCRFDQAYKSIQKSAQALLLAHGFRMREGVYGHHAALMASFGDTLNLKPNTIRLLNRIRQQRNSSDYFSTGDSITLSDLDSAINHAKSVVKMTNEWFSRHHPEVLPPNP